MEYELRSFIFIHLKTSFIRDMIALTNSSFLFPLISLNPNELKVQVCKLLVKYVQLGGHLGWRKITN
jgi:hypothetical protein